MNQPDPSYVEPVVDPALPNVLLIGDSISLGYTLPVRVLLKGVANVHRPPVNCGPSSRGLEHIDAWLGDRAWAVIHFNFGLHDLKYVDEKGQLAGPPAGRQWASVEDYVGNLEALAVRLHQTSAKLIWAATTPVPDGSSGRIAGDEIRYNAAALGVMRRHGIAVNDLHALVLPRLAEVQRPWNVHFTGCGSDVLAAEVARVIGEALRR